MPFCFYCKQNETLFQRTCKTCQMQIFFCDDCEDNHDCSKKQQDQNVENLKQEFEQIKIEEMYIKGQRLILAQIFNINQEGQQIQMILEEEENTVCINQAYNIGDQIYIPMIMEDCCQLNNSSIVTSGGFDSQEVIKESHIIEYRVKNGCMVFKVKRASDMNIERMTHKLVKVGKDRVVAIGGKSQQNYLNSVELYDAVNDTWKFINNMNQHRSQPSALFSKDSLYVYGGFSSQNTVASNIEVYSFLTSSWTLISIDFSPFNNMIVRSLPLVKDKDNILILGGSNGNQCANHILNFNTNTSTLTSLSKQLIKSRVYGEGFYNAVDQSITFIGGTNSEQNLSLENIQLKEQGISSIENVNYSDELQIQCFPHFMWLTLMNQSQ